jgi:hypothetical protein
MCSVAAEAFGHDNFRAQIVLSAWEKRRATHVVVMTIAHGFL